MRLLSPPSRLVLATLVIAALALAVAGRNPAPQVGDGASPSRPGLAQESNAETASSVPSGEVASTVEASDSASPGPPTESTPNPAPPTVKPTANPVACTPTDQDKYVYNPTRLEVSAACIRVTGTVGAVREEADGDLHILLALDPKYAYLLRPANQGEELGDLVIEPVCVRTVTQLDAEAICASDPDPLAPPFPFVGEQVWMEGRYVFDLDHGGWAELHPLYRWGVN